MELLQKFDFDVKSKENVVVDALSKRPLANTISSIRNSMIDEIKLYYINDDFFKVHLKVWLRKLGLLMRLIDLNLFFKRWYFILL